MRGLFVFCGFLFFLWGCSSSVAEKPIADTQPKFDSTPLIYKQIDGAKKAKAIDAIFSAKHDADLFNGSVLVAQRGVVVYKKTFGWFDYGKKTRLADTSAIQIASVSKQFTAAAIMLLKQRGLLRYDDPVEKYLPNFPYTGITIRHLLTHRSGLSRYTDMCDIYFRELGNDPDVYNNDSVLALMNRLKPAPFAKPGEKFKYSNTGYVLLASVVEKISKQKFAAFMQINFFDTLGMKHTWINDNPKNQAGKAISYYRKWERWDENYLDAVTGDKGVYTNPTDLFIWDRALKQGSILSRETVQDAFIGASPELEEKEYWNYGFGWRTIAFKEDGAKAVFHNGWWHGSTSVFYRGVSDDVTIIILCNKFNRGIYNVQAILQLLGAHHLPFEEEEVPLSGKDSAKLSDSVKQTHPEKKPHAKKKSRH
ncbi:MAG: serine hydrolase domain-containing protein [Bacteroidia bacterium]